MSAADRTQSPGRIFITGSSDGIGREAARQLASRGYSVTLHARDAHRAAEALEAVPDAASVLVGDLGSLRETRALADEANQAGRFDAVIHNAGVGFREPRRVTADGVEHVFQINVLAPYLLTALLHRPDRLVYVSSGLHRQGSPDLSDVNWERRRWDGMQAYSDSKLFDVVLAKAVARRWPDVRSNSMEPGWVRTKMGGSGAPRGVAEGADTQVWLTTSSEAAGLGGRHFEHRQERPTHPAADDPAVQAELLEVCRQYSGVPLEADVPADR
jgi:NAD(P)-dependent dehydrogenase (short-subunit alcohol dehydrogenase family)